MLTSHVELTHSQQLAFVMGHSCQCRYLAQHLQPQQGRCHSCSRSAIALQQRLRCCARHQQTLLVLVLVLGLALMLWQGFVQPEVPPLLRACSCLLPAETLQRAGVLAWLPWRICALFAASQRLPPVHRRHKTGGPQRWCPSSAPSALLQMLQAASTFHSSKLAAHRDTESEPGYTALPCGVI